MLKKFLLCSSILSLSLVAYLSADGTNRKGSAGKQSRLESKVRKLPDSLFTSVEKEDLLDDEVYIKLAHEGWSAKEIVAIMNTAIADKKAAKRKMGYGNYAKQWLPTYGRQPGDDTLYMYVDTLFTEKMRKSVAAAVPEDLLNAYWPEIKYIPPKMRSGGGDENRRIGGYFRQPKFNPSCGRIYWIALHPEDHDKLYVIPDGAGIYKTDNGGEHWECITHTIPNRSDRSRCLGYNIPVDPDNWDHVFAFMNNSTVYETWDAGKSWRKIIGATHKTFKRGDCFRDRDGNLKFIGCTNKGWNSILWISEDTCKTWTAVTVPDELKEINPQTGARGLWFQYIVTDPTDRNKIYLPTSRSIFYFDDGAKSEIVNGKRVYNIKKMELEVYDAAHNQRRYADYPGDKGADVNNTTIFPCPATAVGDMVINPNDPNQWWFATGSALVPNSSAIYRSDDGGRTWTTLQDVIYGIGSGNIFGNELPGPWLGGFGVNFADTTKVYGCSMSSGKSFDGGRNCTNYHWGSARPSKHTDGKYYQASASRHNADNHCIRSHKSGRVFRGSDGGMFVIDPNINDGDWTHIGSDMGQMLFYHIAVNEFGDQVMAGNTQDIDGQTYRYGRWGFWRGYEGSESFINPYTGAVYLPSTGYQGLDPSMISLGSWQNGTTRADVVTGSWFIARAGSATNNRSLLRCDDFGQKLVNLEPLIGEGIDFVGKLGLCRDKGRSTVFVVTKSHFYKRSIDGGRTFENLLTPAGAPVKFSNSVIATDPNNSDILYVGQQGKVHRYNIVDGTLEKLGGESLPNIPCTHLMFHEGSGDLYFYHAGSAGIYILEYDKASGQYAPAWRFWTKGYNPGKATNVEINYTTQEMVLCDYGHGVWVADLEHPSDRFFDDGFQLKELSFKDGRRTIGIDTEWTIPLYYYYKWTVNGEVIDNPYQYLRRVLNPGDRVQLELTLRESPDVHTLSSVFVVPEVANNEQADNNNASSMAKANEADQTEGGNMSYDNNVTRTPGYAIYSDGQGRVDLGYTDFFFEDFTIDFWLKPNSNGTILSNTTAQHSDAKGWILSLDGGALKFQYYPQNQVRQPKYETPVVQNGTVRGGSVNFGKWNHVAVTQQRRGNIVIYLNGIQVASANRINPDGSLNNMPVLSLFADAIESNTIEATVDELKIWTKALSMEEVRREMYSTNADNKDGLVAYYPFNGGSLENEKETFTRRPVKSRVNAVVQYPMMSVPTCAKGVVYDEVSGPEHTFSNDSVNLIRFTVGSEPQTASAGDEAPAKAASLSGNFGVYSYDIKQWQRDDDNIDSDYFDQYPVGYLIHPFGNVSDIENFVIEFFPVSGEFDATKKYRFYTSDINDEKQSWIKKGNVSVNEETGALTVTGLSLSDVTDKKLLITVPKPSIEIMVEGMGIDGVLPVYNETQNVFALTANTVAGLEEPADIYQIESDGILKPSGLYFAEGEAYGELRLDLSKLGGFNTNVRATLRSNDNAVEADSLGRMRPSLIPLTIDVRNRIMPRAGGTALKLENARADIGNQVDMSKMEGSRNLTIMGWVRVDSIKNLQYNGFNLLSLYHPAGGGVTALRLKNGKLEFAHNGKVRGGVSNKLFLTQADLGKWVHLAVVLDASKNCFNFYMNGLKDSGTYNNVEKTNSVVGFHIGKNSAVGSSGNTDNFCGAIDQVGVWNRALSQDEVIRYMYSVPSLDDPNLVAYQNMDYADEKDVRRDCYNMAEIKTVNIASLSGKSNFDEPTPIPFDARAVVSATSAESPISLTFQSGKERDAVISTFRGTPYCYLNHDFQSYSALNQEFYGITYRDYTDVRPAATDSVILKYSNRIIKETDKLAVAGRRTGTLDHLAGFIHAQSVGSGEATFKVPGSFLTDASEIMFFTYPDSSDDTSGSYPANIQMGFGRAVANLIDHNQEIPTLQLTEGMDSIPLVADILRMARNNDAPVRIIVNEKSYASVSQDTIDFSKSENQFAVKINRDKINPFGLNPLTINLEGAEANEVRLNLSLEPYVYLTLLNGEHGEIVKPESTRRRLAMSDRASESGNTFSTETPVATLEVNAELLQGFLPEGENVELEVVTDLDHSLNIGNGTLLNNEEVNIRNLEHHSSDQGPRHEGWNLIGNPYLTNINLTKSKNVQYDPERVTMFIYQNNPVTGNYEVYNMTDYDAAQKINPFQSYFVQTMQDDAIFTVTPIAKEEEPTKHTMAYKVAEKKELVLELFKGEQACDRVTLLHDDNALNEYLVNEDAPKMWSLSGVSPELYAVSDDGVETTVNAVQGNTVTLGLKSPESGRLTLSVKSSTGLPENELRILDNVTGHEWIPSAQGNVYEFDATEGNDDNRFIVTLQDDFTTGTDNVEDTGYKIFVEDGYCTVCGLRGNATVDLFTPSGINIAHRDVQTPTVTFSLEPGFYMVVIHEDGKEFVSKIKV